MAACEPCDPLVAIVARPLPISGTGPSNPAWRPHALFRRWFEVSVATEGTLTTGALESIAIEQLTDQELDALAAGHVQRDVLHRLDEVAPLAVVGCFAYANFRGAGLGLGPTRCCLQHNLALRCWQKGRDRPAGPAFAPSPLQVAVWRLGRAIERKAERGAVERDLAAASYSLLAGHELRGIAHLPMADQQLLVDLRTHRMAAHVAADLIIK